MDYSTIIADSLANGQSLEDIVKEFTEAMNKAEAINKSKKNREKFLSDTRAAVKSAVDHDLYTVGLASQILTLVIAEKYPDWEVADLNIYLDGMIEGLSQGSDLLDDILKDDGSFNKIFDSLIGKIDKMLSGEDSDTKILDRFLKRFDLPG